MRRRMRKILMRSLQARLFFCACILFFISVDAGAQKIDSILRKQEQEISYDSAYAVDTVTEADTTSVVDDEEKESHIYDSSARFFNWKQETDEIYYTRKLARNPSSEAAIAALKKDKAFWYIGEIEAFVAKKEEYLKHGDSLARARKLSDDQMLKKRDGFENHPWIRTALWAVIIGILLFALVYFISINKLSLFAKKDIVHKQTEDETAVNIFETEFDEMLAKARAEGNFRLMTRILYLQTLRLLSDKNIIRYSPTYTNLTYIDQLRSTDYYQDFFTITRHYEYVWYGKFDLPKEAYEKIETAIQSFQKRFT